MDSGQARTTTVHSLGLFSVFSCSKQLGFPGPLPTNNGFLHLCPLPVCLTHFSKPYECMGLLPAMAKLKLVTPWAPSEAYQRPAVQGPVTFLSAKVFCPKNFRHHSFLKELDVT